jgi:hypothetical protein
LTPPTEQIQAKTDGMIKAARDFALKNKDIYIGLDAILAAPNESELLSEANKWWAQYQKGFLQLKQPTITVQGPEIEPPAGIENIPQTFADNFTKAWQGKEEMLDFSALFNRDKILASAAIEFAQIGAELPQKIGVLDPITGKEQQVDIDLVFNIADLESGIEKAKKDAQKKADDLVKGINEAFANALVNIQVEGFAGIGEIIGNAISGGDLQNALSALGSQLAGVVEALGKQLIQMGVIAQATQIAIANALTNPFALIAVGIGMTALGAAFRNLTMPKLAEGGIIPDGYPNDTFFARLQSQEAVIPLDRLDQMMSEAGAGDIIPDVHFKGEDFYVSFKRVEKRLNRGS